MSLTALTQPGLLDTEREGVVFLMRDGTETVSILVSLHALEDIMSRGPQGRLSHPRCYQRRGARMRPRPRMPIATQKQNVTTSAAIALISRPL